MVKLRHYTDEVSGLIAFICFMFNAAIIDFNPIELSIFFIIFGICTYSWMDYVRKDYELIVFGFCSFLCIMIVIAILGSPVVGIFLMASSFHLGLYYLIKVINK